MAQRRIASFFGSPKASSSPPATPAGEAATSSEPPAPAPGSPTARTPTAVHPMFCKAPGSPRPAKLKAEAEVDKAVEALRSPVAPDADSPPAKRPKREPAADGGEETAIPTAETDAEAEAEEAAPLLDDEAEGLSDAEGEEAGRPPDDDSGESPATAFNLAKLVLASKYNPIEAAPFKKGEKVPYLHLCRTFETVSQTSSRLDNIVLLCNCFRSILALTPDDLLPAIYLSTNAIAPAHEGLELGVGDALLTKCIADSAGKTDKQVKELYAQQGDLGFVAQSSRATQKTLMKPQPLTVRYVYQTFRDIALAAGKDSGKKRGDNIRKLLVASRETESQFVVRSLQGKMRIGLAEQTVLAALALALVLTPPVESPEQPLAPKSAEKLQGIINKVTQRLKTVYSEVPSYDIIVPRIITKGWHGLYDSRCSISNGLPVKPMLAKPTKGITEVLDRFSSVEFTCEFKYDGERAQIHYDASRPAGQQILIYSRNSENHTTKYPDIIEGLPRAIQQGVTSFIMDSEVVAFDVEEGKVKPFQVLQHRGRKNISLADVKIHVCIHAFDLLYLNGKPLLREPLAVRRKALHDSFELVPGAFRFAEYSDGRDLEVIEAFLQESLKAGCEGLMVKTLKVDATYQPSRRSMNWLKIKKDYLKGMGDSFDLVPIGGYLGRGKRTGWYGGFLLACYDEESEEFQTVCKIGTGFSEALLAEFKTTFEPYVIPQPKPYYRFAEDHRPDVWFTDYFVWEVLAADLSISPAHRGALGRVDPDKGIALRFPRFIQVRADKSATDATSASQVAEMYRRQFTK
eukprot:EG_transcript_2632